MTGEAPTLGSGNLAAAKRLLEEAKVLGFHFQRIATGPDAPLLGRRETVLLHVTEWQLVFPVTSPSLDVACFAASWLAEQQTRLRRHPAALEA